jgi:preprotein translocase subunit SecA
VIESAQARFEQFNFEIRKNLIEYDEAVNRQRQIVYDERHAILMGSAGELDNLVRNFVSQTLDRIIERYGENYEQWALVEIDAVIGDFSNLETGEVNTRGAIQRVLPLFPRPSDEELQDLLSITEGDDLREALHEMVLTGMDEGHHLRMLQVEISRIVPPWPAYPAFGPQGIEGWERFTTQVRELFDGYAQHISPMSEVSAEAIWTPLHDSLEQAFRDQLTNISKGTRSADVQAQFYGQLNEALGTAFRALVIEVEPDDLVETLMARVDTLLEVARKTPQEIRAELARGDGGSGAPGHEAVLYAIGAEQLENYERAMMLSVIDAEWRQYLLAIDDLRTGVGLEAYGQRDPKVEFKRRAFEMFDRLRADVQEGIARRFFVELPRHRQIIEEQKQREAALDRLADSGYRIQQKVTRTQGGQVKVSQTVQKDLWSNVGRNDPCPCGSGKKFKDCHYRQVQSGTQTVKQSQVVKSTGKKGKRRR